MRHQEFSKLTTPQQITLLIAMHVRNEMEDFHVDNLSDAQMKQLNQIIRQAIFDVVILTNEEPKTRTDKEQATRVMDWLIRMIPDYWELPDKTSGSLELPEALRKRLDKEPDN